MKKALIGILLFIVSPSVLSAPILVSLADEVGPLDGGTVSRSFNSPGAGSGLLSFELLGYLSVDGVNCCTDRITVGVNGATVFDAAFGLGGGGTTTVFTGNSSWILDTNARTGVDFNGGYAVISIPVAIVSGLNSLLFDYGTMQGLRDEGWGIQDITVKGTVPEPGTLGLLVLGLVGVGLAKRMRKL